MNFLAAFVLASLSFGNPQARVDSVFWCPQRPLVWTDFKSDSKQNGAATTTVIIHRWVETQAGSVLYVKAVFLREKSSYNPADTTNDLLNHEARHFDIAELVARRTRRDLSGRTFTRSTRKQAYERLRSMNGDFKSLNNVYDSDSGDSQNKEGQLKWNKYISAQLKALEQYAVDCKQASF